MSPSITCPVCGETSYHPDDIANGYCGHCADFTSLVDDMDVLNMEGSGLQQPHHLDFYRMAAVVKQNDRLTQNEENGFAKTFLCDVASLGYMANVRARLIQDELSTPHLNEETLKEEMEISEEEAQRERLVMAWIDAFTAGQKFQALQQVQDERREIYSGPTRDGNRRQRRAKR